MFTEAMSSASAERAGIDPFEPGDHVGRERAVQGATPPQLAGSMTLAKPEWHHAGAFRDACDGLCRRRAVASGDAATCVPWKQSVSVQGAAAPGPIC